MAGQETITFNKDDVGLESVGNLNVYLDWRTPKGLLDLRKITRSQGKSARANSGLTEGEVAVESSTEDRPLPPEMSWSGDEGALRKTSYIKSNLYNEPYRKWNVSTLVFPLEEINVNPRSVLFWDYYPGRINDLNRFAYMLGKCAIPTVVVGGNDPENLKQFTDDESQQDIIGYEKSRLLAIQGTKKFLESTNPKSSIHSLNMQLVFGYYPPVEEENQKIIYEHFFSIFDLSKIARSGRDLSRSETILSDTGVIEAISREEKLLTVDKIRSGDLGVLRQSIKNNIKS